MEVVDLQHPALLELASLGTPVSVPASSAVVPDEEDSSALSGELGYPDSFFDDRLAATICHPPSAGLRPASSAGTEPGVPK